MCTHRCENKGESMVVNHWRGQLTSEAEVRESTVVAHHESNGIGSSRAHSII